MAAAGLGAYRAPLSALLVSPCTFAGGRGPVGRVAPRPGGTWPCACGLAGGGSCGAGGRCAGDDGGGAEGGFGCILPLPGFSVLLDRPRPGGGPVPGSPVGVGQGLDE